MNRDDIWLLEEGFGGERSEAFFAAQKRLHRGEPLAYIIGHIPFLGAKIYLDSHPLIPRPETEFWVDMAIRELSPTLEQIPKPNLLDLCAGSGAIGIALARTYVHANVDFAELNERHHPTIQKNIRENQIDDSRVRIFGGDLFADIPEHMMYDAICANPPYLDASLHRAEDSVLSYEPHDALFSEHKGFLHLERIIANARTYLTVNGALYLEHEPEHHALLSLHAAAHHFDVDIRTDQYGVERYSVLHPKTR